MTTSLADKLADSAAASRPWDRARIAKSVALLVFTGATLALDTVLPSGFSGNVLYVLPIIFASSLGLGSAYLWAALATTLTIVSSVLSSHALPLPWEIADRVVTTGVLWITALLVERLDHQRAAAIAAMQEAAEANLRKSRFLAAASHDLRQPAQSLTLFTAVLRERTAGAELDKVVQPLARAVEALNGMLNGLLELSRLDAGVHQPKPIHVDLSGLLARLATDYGLVAGDRGLAFRARFPAGVALHTDPEFLERILRNLLDNAFKYTVRGFVTLLCFRRRGVLVFQVCDSGPGIPAEHLQTVFEEFFQVGNDERDQAKGLGIGLSVVQRSAVLLGGRVRVWSRLGRGSRFTLMLPG